VTEIAKKEKGCLIYLNTVYVCDYAKYGGDRMSHAD